MKLDFKALMRRKTDDELQVYLDKRSKYVPDAVEAAIFEMQERGHVFPQEELLKYEQEFQAQREAAQNQPDFSFDPNPNWGKGAGTNENAPILYSQRTIYWFTVLFSTIFGAILLALNCRDIGAKKGAYEVFMFGTLYAFLQGFVLSMFPRNAMMSLLFSIIGAIILNQFFWKKHIGRATAYRVKPIWVPLIIGILITCLIALAVFKGIISPV